jgi:hypothetical protein
MHDINRAEKVVMTWQNLTEEVLDMLIYRAKILSKVDCDATSERPNAPL